MDDQQDILSLEEVGRLLSRLRQADLIRLAALARVWVCGLDRRDAADLLNEALSRVLSGQRPWPADLRLPVFLSQVMRSVASQWLREDVREPLVFDEEGAPEVSESAKDGEIDDLIARMRATLADDPPAQGVLEHILLQTSREQARRLLKLDATGYDTARRRMIRTLSRKFNPGWTL